MRTGEGSDVVLMVLSGRLSDIFGAAIRAASAKSLAASWASAYARANSGSTAIRCRNSAASASGSRSYVSSSRRRRVSGSRLIGKKSGVHSGVDCRATLSFVSASRIRVLTVPTGMSIDTAIWS